MRHINYKSDFDFILKLVSCVKADDGTITKSEVGFPDHDWEAAFWTSRRSTSFIASSKGGVLTNCFNDAGQIHIVCNNRGLGPGVLNVEFHAHVPNSMYPDKCMDMYTVVPLDIELVIGESDCMTELDAEVGLPIMYRSVYEDAVQAGFEGTKEEYYQRLTELPDSVEVATTIKQSVEDINEASKDITLLVADNKEVATTIKQSVEDIRAMVADTAAGKSKLIDALEQKGYEVTGGMSFIDMVDSVDKGYLSSIGYDCDEDYTNIKMAMEDAAKAKAEYELNGGNLKNCGAIAPKVVTSGASLLEYNYDVVVVPSYRGLTDCSYMFRGCQKLKYVPPQDMSNVTNASHMFSDCPSLTSVPDLYMPNVTDVSYMFSYCSALTSVPDLYMPNVTNISYMLCSCNKLTNVTLDLPNVTNASSLFENSSNLTDVTLDLPNVTNVTNMFNYSGLKSITLYAKNLTDANSLFFRCSKLTNVTLDLPNVTTATAMYRDCYQLTSVPDLYLPNVTNASQMFYGCSKLTTVTLDLPNVTDASSMFSNCSSLTSISILDTSNVTDASYMFSNCNALTSIPYLNTSNVTDASSMFSYCSALTSIPALDLSNVTDASSMFKECSSLTSVPDLDTSKCTDMRYMFRYCKALTSVPALDLSNVTKIDNMFLSCTVLHTLNINNLGKSSLTNYSCFSPLSAWGSTEEGRQSLIDSLITNSYDRAAAGMSACKITLHANVKARLTDEEKAAITAKGFTIA